MKKLLLLFVTCMALFASCKKKDVEKTTAEKVLGKWGVTSTVTNDFYNGTSHISTQNGIATDYVEFRTDGKAYLLDGTYRDTINYSINADNKIIFDGDIYDIRVLTDNQFVGYNKYIDPIYPTEYFETTFTLYK